MATPFREMHIIGRDSPERVVWASCPAMKTYGIPFAGLTDAGRGYRMQRPQPRHGHVLVTTGGRGVVWIDGEECPCETGQAYLSPPERPMAFHPAPNQRWQFAWVYYEPKPGRPTVVNAEGCRVVDADTWPLATAVLGLYRESVGPAQSAVMDRWVELVQTAVVRITGSLTPEPALGGLWENIDARLAHPWTLGELAEHSGMSREALRLACQKQLGHSPVAQVTRLRMRRAAALLCTTSRTVESIGKEVGYPQPSAFCTAFRRIYDTSPNAYRSRHDSDVAANA